LKIKDISGEKEKREQHRVIEANDDNSLDYQLTITTKDRENFHRDGF
jgi:hypothetical protein